MAVLTLGPTARAATGYDPAQQERARQEQTIGYKSTSCGWIPYGATCDLDRIPVAKSAPAESTAPTMSPEALPPLTPEQQKRLDEANAAERTRKEAGDAGGWLHGGWNPQLVVGSQYKYPSCDEQIRVKPGELGTALWCENKCAAGAGELKYCVALLNVTWADLTTVMPRMITVKQLPGSPGATYLTGAGTPDYQQMQYWKRPLDLAQYLCKVRNEPIGCAYHARGLTSIGTIYKYGNAFKQKKSDLKVAAEWFRQGCDEGDLAGCVLYAEYLESPGAVDGGVDAARQYYARGLKLPILMETDDAKFLDQAYARLTVLGPAP